MATKQEEDTTETAPAADVNEVVLTGRVSGEPQHRVLPSGDELWTLRLVVRRPAEARAVSRASVDTLECSVWGGRARRTAAGLADGDEVEVHGCLRRRFFRGVGGAQSRVDVAVHRLRVTRRAARA